MHRAPAPSDKNHGRTILISAALPLIVLLVSPLTMYLGNQDQYTGSTPLLLAFGGAFLLASIILFALLFVASGWLYRFLGGLLTGLALGAWVQSHILVWDLGPLDGRGISWERFTSESWIELATWITIVTLSIVAFVARRRFTSTLIIGVWMLGITSLGMQLITTSGSKSTEDSAKSDQYSPAPFAFHPANNAIIIVLDTFQSDVFGEILERYPDELEFLSGFRYHPNTIGGYPTTRHSLPLILTGQFYKNDFKYNYQNNARLYRKSLVSFFQELDYGITGDLHHILPRSARQELLFEPKLRDPSNLGLTKEQLTAVDAGLFRASPLLLKPKIYDEGRWLLSQLEYDQQMPPPPHGNDWRLVHHLIREASISSSESGEFKFIHLIGTHYPLSIDEHYIYRKGLADTRENYLNQARGALLLARKILDKLKELGIYEHAEIFIAADHGTHNKTPSDLRGDPDLSDIPPEHFASARPLLLHKAAGDSGQLVIDERPMHLSYIPCMFADGKYFDCTDYKAMLTGREVIRPHYRYEWANQFWFSDYAPPMTLYELRGDARDVDAWTNTWRVYAEGESYTAQIGYRPGTLLDFSAHGNASRHLVSGWSVAEREHTWTDGKLARLRLNLDTPPQEDLTLSIDAAALSPNGSRPQEITVTINKTNVAQWSVLHRGRFDARVPATAMARGKALIDFHIGEPVSPAKQGTSPDQRELGLAVYSLTLQPGE